ncbi:MAG: SIS domain-containing protein [Cyanobacteria bacterium]|nr:SIS domain-containing protein [Cyanobacteriota bacterium]
MSSKHTPVTLLHEIQEQPELFRACIKRYPQMFEALSLTGSDIQGFKRVIGIAEGSSKHALEMAAPFIEAWSGLPVTIIHPENLEDSFHILKKLPGVGPAYHPEDLFLAVSQSGETASVKRSLHRLKHRFPHLKHFLTLTNNPNSSLATEYPLHVCIEAGVEQSIAATKTMSVSFLTLLFLGLYLGKTRHYLSEGAHQQLLDTLTHLPEKITAVWEPKRLAQLQVFTRSLMAVNHFILLSKGPLVLTLPEAGLKLTETSSNIVYTDNTESFKHGPKVMLSGIQGVHPNSIYVVPPSQDLAIRLYKDLRSHFWINPFQPNEALAFDDDRVFFIEFENSVQVPETVEKTLHIDPEKHLMLPKASLLESLFLCLITFQTICYYLACFKGEDPNNPALSKAVTT